MTSRHRKLGQWETKWTLPIRGVTAHLTERTETDMEKKMAEIGTKSPERVTKTPTEPVVAVHGTKASNPNTTREGELNTPTPEVMTGRVYGDKMAGGDEVRANDGSGKLVQEACPRVVASKEVVLGRYGTVITGAGARMEAKS